MMFSPFGRQSEGRSLRSRRDRGGRRRRSRVEEPRGTREAERLEQRRLLAFDFVAAFASDSSPFYVSGVTPGTQVLQESPQQMTLRFSPGVAIDSSSLDAISMTRLDGGLVKLGSITVNDAPNQNEVILRFAESLPDATYRIDIGAGLASTSTAVGTVNAARFDVKVEIGAHVVSVVPQPVSRGANGLTQAKNQIVVYFNANDPLNQNSAESTSNYKLYEIDPTTGAGTLSSIGWAQTDPVVYNATAATATLTFAADLDNNKLYRLQVGNNGTAGSAAINVDEKIGGTDNNSSFATARELGILGTAGASVGGALDVRPSVSTPAGALPFPSEPGAIDEPGHRDISVNLDPPDADGVQIINTGEDHGLTNAAAGLAGAVHVQAYNFKSFYGFGAQGQQLYNAISEAQKQRAREVFELYSRYTGIRFVETASDGITVVTGDMRAIDPDIITTPDGLTGTPIDLTGGRVFGVTAIMDATNNWGSSEYGGAWFREAMEQIGHALGLSNSFDIPSIMGAALPGEPVFPGDYDVLHAEMLYPNSGTDIDLYRFELPSAGRLVAETFVARPGQPILSKADTVLTLYRQDASGSREMIARNDDSFGTDSFVELDLAGGVYFVAITSAGNTDFNPEIENSGANGRSDGAYELRLNFTPDATAAGTIVDDSGTLFDGDRDGAAGGVFNFWFRTGDTVFVDKAAATAGANGSLANPYPTIGAAIQNIGARSIIRIVGNNSQTPYQIGRNASNVALPDGATLNVPRNVTVMIDEGAVFKLSKTNIDVGTSAAAASRAGAALQVLGTPTNRVTFTSYHDDTIGGNTDGFGPATQGGQWGGIVLRQDSDVAGGQAFLNTIANADIRYGGGQVLVDSRLQTFSPIHLETTRPTIVFNQITNSAGAAISADPNSFEDDGQRMGPEIRGNILEEVKTVQGIGASVAGTTTTVTGAVSTVVAAVTNNTVITLTSAVARVGAVVSGIGVLDGTTVTAVSGTTVTLSRAVTVAANAVLTFSLANQSIAGVLAVAVADPNQVRVGAPVAGTGVPDGTTVASISGSVVTFSRAVTLTQGTVLSSGWAAGQAELRISEQVARVGASLFINGIDSGLDVSAIDASGTLTLSGNLPQTLVGGSSIGFSFVAGAGAVATSRIRVADLAGITVGGVVSGVPGVPPGTKVVSVTSQTEGVMVEFDQRVEVVSGTPIGFGSNSINGLFIRIKTNAGSPIDRLDVPARFKSTDITYVLAENLIVSGGAGGYVDVAIATPRANLVAGATSFTLPTGTVAANGLTVGMRVTGPGIPDGTAVATIAGDVITVTQPLTRSQSQATVTFYQEQARQSGRLTIDPGVIVKLDRSRIELERGVSQLFAEGTAGRRVIFTSLADNRFGAGGTFDTNGNQPDKFDQFGRSIDIDGALLLSPTTGDWGGIVLNAGAKASIDQAYLAFGGGITPIEGGFDQFNVIEVHQGDLRLANSRIERNAEGLATTDRTGRQGNDSATIFVRGAQPVIIRNDFRDNAGAMISINANSLNDSLVPDPGRGTGAIQRYGDYDANFGPLVRDNRISYLRNTPVTGGAVAAAPAPSSTGSSSSAPAATITQMQWNGQTTSVVANSWVFRAADESFAIDAGWQATSLGGGFYSMTAPGAGVQDVLAWSQSQTAIDFVEPNFVRTISALPNDPSFSSLWGLENTGQPGGQEGWDFTGGLPTVGVIDADIDAPAAWDVTTGSRNVVVAVIDTGVDYTHEDLAANMWRNPGEIPGNNIDDDGNGFVDDVFGWDFGSNDNDPNDDSADPGHGTHVAGTIGAVGNNGVGVTGVNWNVGIMALKIADNAGNLTTSAIIGAINYVTMMREQFGVNVVASNNSYGGYGISSAERAAIDAHCAADVVFVAAAGNDSINNDVFPAYPASHNNSLVISVAATDRANQLARFSNTGPTTVDIAAPGVAILSTTPGNNYEYYSGTSMASPHVAGVVGLLAAAFPNATGAQMRDAILDSAVPVASLANRVATGGLLNVAAALDTLRGTTGISGMVVRGQEITVESVWDDTDIVHVLRSEIVVNNFHTKTGLRLLSQPDESLVVKLQGTTAGFTATGTALDIDDRIGGTVQLVGQPGYPVVLTSLADDTVGVSLDALGRVVRDTNGDGSASSPAPGDWRSLRFEPLSNDRNVAILVEREAGVTGGIDANGTTDDAQVLGTLAPNYATTNDQGTLNSWESAQEKSGDESLRQGFEVHGSVAFDDPNDVDVYTFTGYAGSEVWIDVDNTSPSLDAMVELLDASGTVIARSADSLNDIGVVRVAPLSSLTANVTGERATVVGTAAATTGVGAQVQGATVQVTGVAARVTGYQAQVIGIGAQAAQTVAAGQTTFLLDDANGVRIGATATLAGVIGVGARVTAVNGNAITLDQPLTNRLNQSAWIAFDISGLDPFVTNRIVFDTPPQVGEWIGDDLSGNNVQAIVGATNSIALLTLPVTIAPEINVVAAEQTFDALGTPYIESGAALDAGAGVQGSAGSRFYRLVEGDFNGGDNVTGRLIGFNDSAQPNWQQLTARVDVRYTSVFGSADGFSFGLIDSAVALPTNGDFATGATSRAPLNEVLLHLDNYQNPGDPNRNHLSVAWGNSLTNFDLPFDWDDGTWRTVEISVGRNAVGTPVLTVSISGSVIVNEMQLAGYTLGQATRFQVGGRSGAEYGRHDVDNLFLETLAPTGIGDQPVRVGISSSSPVTAADIVLDNVNPIQFGSFVNATATSVTNVSGLAVSGEGVVTFSSPVSVVDRQLLSLSLAAGQAVTTTYITVDDASQVVVGAEINGAAGIPLNTRVIGRDLAVNMLQLSQPITVSLNDLAGIGFFNTYAITVADATTLAAGMEVFGVGVPDGTTIAAGGINGNQVTLTSPVDVADDQFLRFGFLNSAVTTDTLYLDDTAATVGSTVARATSPTVILATVVAIDPASGAITLDAAVSIDDGDLLMFSFNGQPAVARRVVLDSTTVDNAAAIAAPILVNLVGAPLVDQRVPDGTSVVAYDAVVGSSILELSQAVTVSATDQLGFGFSGTQIVVNDVTDIEIDQIVSGPGVPVGVRVVDSAILNPLLAPNTVVVSAAVGVEDATPLTFTYQPSVVFETASSAQATVDGVNQAVTGVAALATGVVARVVGETESVTGVAALTTGVAAQVVGRTQAATGVAALPTGVAAVVVGEREDVVGLGARVVGTNTTVSGVATTVTAAVADNSTVDVATPGVVRVGAAVSGAGIPGGTTVLLVNGNSVTLSQPVTVAANAVLTFAQANQTISNNLVAVADPTQVRVGAGVTGGGGVPAGTTVQNISGSVIQLSQPITLTQGATLTFGWIGNRLGIDEAVADVGASLFIDGVDTGLVVAATDVPGTLLTLGGANGGNLPRPLADGSLVSFSFVGGGTVGTTRIRVADRTGISVTGLVNGVNGVPAGTRVAAITNDTAGTGAIITLNQSVDVANGNRLGFGSNTTSLAIDTAGFAGQLGGVSIAITRNGASAPNLNNAIVQSITGSTVNVSGGAIDVADGDMLGFSFAGAARVTTNRIRIDGSVDPRVNADVSINDGSPLGTIQSFDPISRVVTLNNPVTVSVGVNDVVGFSFVGNAAEIATRVRVADRTGIVAGVLVNSDGAAPLPPETRVVAVIPDSTGVGGTIVLDSDPNVAGNQPISVANGDSLRFGFNASAVTIDTAGFGGQLGGVAITRNGVDALDPTTNTPLTVDSIDNNGVVTVLGGFLDVAHGDVLGFHFAGAAVTTNRIRIDGSVNPSFGAAVSINGGSSVGFVGSFDAASRTVTLTGGATASVSANDVIGFSFAGNPETTTRVRVADSTGITVGALVNGFVSVPANTQVRVADVRYDNGAAGGPATIEFDQAVTVAAGDTLGFGSNATTVTIDTAGFAGQLGGVAITRNGIVALDPTTSTPLTVGSIGSSGVVTVAGGSLDVADGDYLGFAFAGNAAVTTDRIRIDGSVAPTVGAQVLINGSDSTFTVAEFDAVSRTVTLNGAGLSVEFNDVVGFSFVGPVQTTRIRVADVNDIDVGVLVNGIAGVPAGSRVVSVTADDGGTGGTVELDADPNTLGSQPVFVANGDVVGFGFLGTAVVVGNAADIELNGLVGGAGVTAGTTVGNVNPNTNTLTLSQTIDVEDGVTLFFGTRSFQLFHQNILPGTLSGVLYLDNTAIQTFTVARDGTFAFTPVGDPAARVIDALATIDYATGSIRLPFDVVPTGTTRLEVSYEYGRLTRETLGFSATGQGGAMSLAKDDYRGVDMYSTNPRNPGMRVVLPGVAGTETQYFVRVRSQSAYDAATSPAAYETTLANPTGASSGHYELRIRERQQDEKPGSTVRYADLRYPTVGIDVIGLPRNSQLVGETGEMAAANDAFGQAQQLGNLLATDRNTISVAGTTTNESDIDWYTFTVDFTDIDNITGVNDAAKTWATMFDIDYADGFKGDLTISVFDAAGRLIYVGRDSNITDDQPGENQGNDFDDLSRGSIGVLDPYIGSVQLPAGAPGATTRYYVAISSNERLPTVMNATFQANAANPAIRLEPVSSVRRIVEDHIGSVGYLSNGNRVDPITGPIIDTANLGEHIQPFTLADVTLFVSNGSEIYTVDAYSGGVETRIAAYGPGIGDLDMRTDGRLYQYFRIPGDTANRGVIREIDPGSGSIVSTQGDGIRNDAVPADANAPWTITGGSVDALAIRRSGIAQYDDGYFYSVRDPADGNASILYQGDSAAANSAAAVQNVWYGRRGEIGANLPGGSASIGHTTGMQFRSESGALYGVSNQGFFYQINSGNGNVSNVVDFRSLGINGFQGLASGPVNLEGGRFGGTFFAITDTGRLVCIDPTTGSLRTNVFDTNGDGRADSHISNVMLGGATGLAFSPLDINLWSTTTRRSDGINAAPDLSRGGGFTGGLSMYFGLQPTDGQGANFGVLSASWRDDLLANPSIGTNYNLAGGAYGSLTTNAFSLAGYDSTDKPTLYFSYFLDTQNANSLTDGMLDSARVFASVDNGLTWRLVASNNTTPTNVSSESLGVEVPRIQSVSSAISAHPNQRVQELFDSTGVWRQARVDLGDFAGESNLKLRFDFSTAGEMDDDDRSTSAPDSIQGVAINPTAGALNVIALDSTAGLEVGMSVRWGDDQETMLQRTVAASAAANVNVQLTSVNGLVPGMAVTSGVGNLLATIEAINAATTTVTLSRAVTVTANASLFIQRVDPRTTIQAIDSATNTITLSNSVGVSTGSTLNFFRPGLANLRNDLLDNSNVFGNFGAGQGPDTTAAARRGAANQFEGFYIDDIIVGFAERGEMVTGSAADQSFFDIGTPISTLYDAQVLQGEYQLEIRRGTEFAEIVTATTPSSSAVSIFQTFDTNDRLVRAPAGAEIVLERNALTAIGGAIGSFGNGQANPLDLDGDGVSDAIVLQGNGNAANPGDGVALTWSIDLARQPSAFFEIEYATGANEALRPLPESFLTDADHEIPKGDGVAVSVDGGVTWTTVAQLGVTNGQWRTARIDLVASLSRVLGNLPVGQSHLTSQTVIGVFKSGFRQFPAGGLVIRNAIITAAPRTQNVGLVGDSNLPRQQGRFLIENNFIAEASLYGVRIDAARDNGIVSLQPGVARNLPTLNYGRLAPGVVVTNNVIAGSGTAGILFSGDSNSSGNAAPLATVPYGRIVNNTIYGDMDAQNAPRGVGVSVEQSAAPTLLNNLFANLASGILVDGSSIADGLGNSRTVVGYSGFYNVTTEVSAAVTANNSITLPADPFVAADRGNFYLAPQSRAIDSAIDVLQDRNEFVVVNNQVGIPESPILAPARDIYGQLRSDDPSVAWTGSGLGFNVFKDRGAIDRVDFTQPTIQVAVPLDNSGDDQESARNIVKLISQAARGQLQFVLQLDDVGAGIDKTTVATEAFEIWYSSYPGAPAQQLVDGADYFFRYLETRNQVVFDSAVVFPLGTYEFRVTSRGGDDTQSPLLIDLAGNTVLPNANGGVISFTVSLVDVPAVPTFIRAVADEGQVSLEWTAFANGAVITAYELQQSQDGVIWSSVSLPSATATQIVRTGLIDGDSYRFRVRATNERGIGDWAEVGPLTPLKVPALVLREDTGVAWDLSTLSDHVTRNPVVNVNDILPGAMWEYSVDGGGSWEAGDATSSFSLSEGTYAAGLIRVRQTEPVNGATSSVGQNSVAWTIDQTPPTALSGFTVYDNVGLIKKYLRSGETTDDATPFVSGTSEASGFVNVGWNVFPFTATAPVLQDGRWSLQMPELPDGARSLVFKAMDRAGNESGPVSFDLLIASVLPSVTIDEVRDDQRPVEGAIQPGGSTNDLTPVLTGTAAPNSVVRVVAHYQNQTQALGSVVATALGNWTLTAPALNIASGTVSVAFEATVTDSVGRVGTSGSYPIVVDLQAPVAPSITAAADNVGSVTGTVANGGTSDDFTPTLSGTREVGSTINILVTLPSGQSTLPQPVVPAANGTWSWTPSAAFTTVGSHVFRAIATDAAGNSSSMSAPFTINLQGAPGTPEPQQPPTITAVVPGSSTALANNASTASRTLILGGVAPADTVVTVRNGSVAITTVTASQDGIWSYQVTGLSTATHQFTAAVNGQVSTTLTITVTASTIGGTPIAVAGTWGPVAPSGGSTIYLDFNQAVSGMSLEVVTILHRGRSVSLRGGSVTSTDNQRYVISLPVRLRTGSGSYEIMLAHELIRSVLDPNTTLDPNDSRVTLPDAGLT